MQNVKKGSLLAQGKNPSDMDMIVTESCVLSASWSVIGGPVAQGRGL